MSHYVLHLTFNWSSDKIKGTDYYPLTQKLLDSHGKVVPPEKEERHDFKHDDTVSLRVFQDGDQGIPKTVNFVFTHAADCPSESGPKPPGLNDNPFKDHDGHSASWPLIKVPGSTSTVPGDPIPVSTSPYWKVDGVDPRVTLKSKVGKAEETWHFAIYLHVSGPGTDGMVSHIFRFDPELVVDPW